MINNTNNSGELSSDKPAKASKKAKTKDPYDMKFFMFRIDSVKM